MCERFLTLSVKVTVTGSVGATTFEDVDTIRVIH